MPLGVASVTDTITLASRENGTIFYTPTAQILCLIVYSKEDQNEIKLLGATKLVRIFAELNETLATLGTYMYRIALWELSNGMELNAGTMDSACSLDSVIKTDTLLHSSGLENITFRLC